MIKRGFVALLVYGSVVSCANAQFVGGGPMPTPAPTLTHELTLIVIGAVLGGLLGPVLQVIDSWLGITPGAKELTASYAVQRDIAANIQKLVDKMPEKAPE